MLQLMGSKYASGLSNTTKHMQVILRQVNLLRTCQLKQGCKMTSQKHKDIGVPLHIMKAHGKVDAQLQSFSSSELNGGK